MPCIPVRYEITPTVRSPSQGRTWTRSEASTRGRPRRQHPSGGPQARLGPRAFIRPVDLLYDRVRDHTEVSGRDRDLRVHGDTDLSLRRRLGAQLLRAERLIATAVPGLSMCGSPRMVTSSGAPSSTR